MTQSVLIHAKPSMITKCQEDGLTWSYSKQFGTEEIDVIVDNIPYEVVDGIYQDPDEQLCEHYGINYDLVNCIEAID